MERDSLLTARQVLEYLQISLFTLAKIEEERKIVPYRTPGGHRRYSMEMLQEYLKKSQNS